MGNKYIFSTKWVLSSNFIPGSFDSVSFGLGSREKFLMKQEFIGN